MKKIITLIFALTFSLALMSQGGNSVLVKELQGQYNGESKKGLAQGDGAAKGTDTYIGEFKKGYPNGFGVYTYLNGSTYVGAFKKGIWDGYGLLNDMSSGVRIQYYGLWISGKLVIPNDARGLYKVDHFQGASMIVPVVKRGNEYKTQIFIEFTERGVPTKTATIQSFEISSGEYVNNMDRTLNREIQFANIEEFPVTLKLKYLYKQVDWRNQDCEFEVTLFVPGEWTIKLEHTH